MGCSNKNLEQRTERRGIRWCLCWGVVAASLLLTGGSAMGQVIPAGIDAWHTPSGGGEVTLPAGALCMGQSEILVSLKGSPIVTSPSGVLGTADTIVERTASANPIGANYDQVPLRVVALKLESVSSFIACGTIWTLDVKRDPSGSSPNGFIRIYRNTDGIAGGSFNASFPVDTIVDATPVTGSPVSLAMTNTISNLMQLGEWATLPAPNGGLADSGAISIDSTGNGTANLSVAGTGPFRPGVRCTNGSCSTRVLDPVPHDSPEHAHTPEPPTPPPGGDICGMGPSLALILPMLMAFRHHRRRLA